MIDKVNINLGDVRYPLYVGSGLISEIPKFKTDFGIKGYAYVIMDEFIFQSIGQSLKQYCKKRWMQKFSY